MRHGSTMPKLPFTHSLWHAPNSIFHISQLTNNVFERHPNKATIENQYFSSIFKIKLIPYWYCVMTMNVNQTTLHKCIDTLKMPRLWALTWVRISETSREQRIPLQFQNWHLFQSILNFSHSFHKPLDHHKQYQISLIHFTNSWTTTNNIYTEQHQLLKLKINF